MRGQCGGAGAAGTGDAWAVGKEQPVGNYVMVRESFQKVLVVIPTQQERRPRIKPARHRMKLPVQMPINGIRVSATSRR